MKLKEYLIEKRISYQDLANYCGVTKKLAYRWCNGELPNSLIVAFLIEKLSEGKITMHSLAEEAFENATKKYE